MTAKVPRFRSLTHPTASCGPDDYRRRRTSVHPSRLPTEALAMIFSTDFGNGDVLLWFFEIFLFVVWFWLLIAIFGDLFRDHELSGGVKALWAIFIIVVPFLGIFIYLIVRGGGMAARSAKQMQAA